MTELEFLIFLDEIDGSGGKIPWLIVGHKHYRVSMLLFSPMWRRRVLKFINRKGLMPRVVYEWQELGYIL